MLIRKLDGSSIIEIDAIGSRLKEACDAEDNGMHTTARRHLAAALQAERDLWVAKNAKQRMLGRRCI